MTNFFFTFVFYLFVYLSLVIATNSNNLKQLHVIFRHGERTPSSSYPSSLYKNFKWPEGLGMLTKRGKYEMFQLGKELADSYISFIPPYNPENVDVRSSYADRCLMSAQLVTAGMFPPENEQIWNEELLWQPIPVHYLPRNVDNNIAMKSKCPKYDAEFKDTLQSEKVQAILYEYADLLKYLTENTGRNISTVENVEEIYNILMMEQENGLDLPNWANNKTLLDEMHTLAATNLALYSETNLMKRLKGGKLLKDIITSMKTIINGKKAPSVVLWSGHDLTIVHICRALNLFGIHKPGYAANLILELHADQEVKIKYQDSPECKREERFIENCSTPCYLHQFEKALKLVLPENWNEECKLE